MHHLHTLELLLERLAGSMGRTARFGWHIAAAAGVDLPPALARHGSGVNDHAELRRDVFFHEQDEYMDYDSGLFERHLATKLSDLKALLRCLVEDVVVSLTLVLEIARRVRVDVPFDPAVVDRRRRALDGLLAEAFSSAASGVTGTPKHGAVPGIDDGGLQALIRSLCGAASFDAGLMLEVARRRRIEPERHRDFLREGHVLRWTVRSHLENLPATLRWVGREAETEPKGRRCLRHTKLQALLAALIDAAETDAAIACDVAQIALARPHWRRHHRVPKIMRSWLIPVRGYGWRWRFAWAWRLGRPSRQLQSTIVRGEALPGGYVRPQDMSPKEFDKFVRADWAVREFLMPGRPEERFRAQRNHASTAELPARPASSRLSRRPPGGWPPVLARIGGRLGEPRL